MFARAASGSIVGIEAHTVVVESHRAKGLPGMAVIGLARGAVRESAVRVRSAIMATGVHLGHHRLVVNLLPAELPKEASALDLALAVSLLASGGLIPAESLQNRRFYGELSLSGGVEPVRGAVLLADLARQQGDGELMVPSANAHEAAVIPGIRVLGVRHLKDVVGHLKGSQPLNEVHPIPISTAPRLGCFSDVAGQGYAKRALEVAAAGGHNILMIGPPGSGKTMLARRLPSVLPPLSPEESIEVTRIHSAVRAQGACELIQTRPFRAPHHTSSEPALCGGGGIPRPGEITLAHRGILFLDELPEFSRRALEALREPLEEGFINIARASMSLTFPASVLLVAAMNPCPCGRYRLKSAFLKQNRGIPKNSLPCVCSFEQIQRYWARISGPLLDRIDLHVMVHAVPYRDFARSGDGDSSVSILGRVIAARQRQALRLGPHRTNATMQAHELRTFVALDGSAMQLLETAVDAHGLSARAIGRVLKMARTLADLDAQESVQLHHMQEAMGFRLLDRVVL